MSIKEEIKKEITKMLDIEEENVNTRARFNSLDGTNNFDCECEANFISKLRKFIDSI